MIKIENISISGFPEAIRGMRNPMNSWNKIDSSFCDNFFSSNGQCTQCEPGSCINGFVLGNNDKELMTKLAKAGSEHAKYRRMITVYADITAPLYWYKEADTYKVGTVSNSCSTMHKIHSKEFTLSDFSCDHLYTESRQALETLIDILNYNRDKFLETNDKEYWWQMIQLLPSSYNQKRTLMLNYEVLSNIYKQRKTHKLDEWRVFCSWIETLPYAKNLIY